MELVTILLWVISIVLIILLLCQFKNKNLSSTFSAGADESVYLIGYNPKGDYSFFYNTVSKTSPNADEYKSNLSLIPTKIVDCPIPSQYPPSIIIGTKAGFPMFVAFPPKVGSTAKVTGKDKNPKGEAIEDYFKFSIRTTKNLINDKKYKSILFPIDDSGNILTDNLNLSDGWSKEIIKTMCDVFKPKGDGYYKVEGRAELIEMLKDIRDGKNLENIKKK